MHLRTLDGLDRVDWSHRLNARGGSPGEYRTFEYYPGGQLAKHEIHLGRGKDALREGG